MVSNKKRVVQRARKDEDKAARRQVLLAAALAELEAHPYAAIKIADVAKRAKLSKGTVFLYFATREALFLGLLQDQLDSWLGDVDAALTSGSEPLDAVALSAILSDSLRPRRALVQLLAILATVLEHNVDAAEVARFKSWLLTRLTRTGERLERRQPHLQPGEGARLLLFVDALVIGLHQLAEPGPTARAVLASETLAPLRIDFDTELKQLLPALLRGLERTASSRRTP